MYTSRSFRCDSYQGPYDLDSSRINKIMGKLPISVAWNLILLKGVFLLDGVVFGNMLSAYFCAGNVL